MNSKKTNCCEKKDNFNYHEIENALCGKQYFNPQRILILQMK